MQRYREVLASLDKWLGKKPWDVIHFNWGLHDLKYMGPNGENLADPKAKDSAQQVSETDYEKNLDELVTRLAETGATLIWCSTTPVPRGAKGRVAGDAVKYNAIAARVMARHKVEINDLYAFAKTHQADIQRKANVHFHAAGSRKLAKTVAHAIRAALDKR